MTITEFIETHYGTIAELARRTGMSYPTAFNKVKRRISFKVDEINRISEQTEVPVCEVMAILKNEGGEE